MRGIWLSFLICLNLVCALRINEILYNPMGDENSQEYVEIYGEENLSGYVFGDLAKNQTLKLTRWNATNYSLIVTDTFNTTGIDAAVYTIGTRLGNGLGNTGDTVYLYLNHTLLDFVTYNDDAVEGHSLEYVDEKWLPSLALGGTPGSPHSERTTETGKDVALEALLGPVLYDDIPYETVLRLRNLDNQVGHDNLSVHVYYNLSQNQTLLSEETLWIYLDLSTSFGKAFFNQTGNATLCAVLLHSNLPDPNPSNDYFCQAFEVLDPQKILCNATLSVWTDRNVYATGDQITYGARLTDVSYPYEINLKLKDLSGRILKQDSVTTGRSRTYTIRNNTVAVWLTADVLWIACNSTGTTHDEKVVGVLQTRNPDSFIYIHSFSPSNPEASDNLKVRLNLYKGDTTKTLIKATLEKNGKNVAEQRFYTHDPYTYYDLSFQLPIPDCLEGGSYSVVVEGLDASTARKIPIQGHPCKNQTLPKQKMKETVEVISLYTRAKNYDEKVKVYTTLEGHGDYTAILEGPLDVVTQDVTLNSPAHLTFQPAALPGKNLFVLKINDPNGRTVTMDYLARYLTLKNTSGAKKRAETTPTKTLYGKEEPVIKKPIDALSNPVSVKETFTNPTFPLYGLIILFLVTLGVLSKEGCKV